MNETIANQLQSYYTHLFKHNRKVNIKNISCISTGWESEMYSFDLEYESGSTRETEQLVLRIYPGENADRKSVSEFHSLQQLHRSGYPVPHVKLLERAHSPFGRPFIVMERIKGPVLGSLLFHSVNAHQAALLTQFCELFVRLHRLDWQPFLTEPQAGITEPYFFIDYWLAMAHSYLERFQKSEFLPVLRWIVQRRDLAPCERPSVIHGDFHPFNVLVRDDGSAVVIDWTGAGVSDARFDLAWTLTLASAYHGREWRDRILKEYEQAMGSTAREIEVFEVCAYARRLFDITVSLTEGPEKLGMRPQAVEMMRREMGAARRVYELLIEQTQIRISSIEKMLSVF
jgi:aminoglycoside phosphotransferase (APT) family kinase protein